MAKLVECVPNFSVSREKDPAVFQGLVDTANSITGCFVFDVQSDGNHNRCVFTLLGSPEAMTEAAFQLTKKATETIDMRRHTGQHPRMGATDVIPFIPTMDTSVEECVELSKRVAPRIWDELRVPSFLYEDSASRPERRNLAACRKGQFEGMPEKLLEPDWAPDYGERKIHQTAGIIAHDGVPQLDGAGLGVGAIEAQGHAKQRGSIARHGDIHELTGLERTCKLGGRDDEREDAVGDLLVRYDLEVVHACSGRCGHRRSNPPCGCMVKTNRKRGTARAPRTKAIRLC